MSVKNLRMFWCQIAGIIFLSVFEVSATFACTPMAPRPADETAEQSFRESEIIITATIISIENYKAKILWGESKPNGEFYELPAERVTFRVDEVFKGNLKPGDLYVTDTTIPNGNCAISADNDPEWAESPVGEPPIKLSRHWLLVDHSLQKKTLSSRIDMPLDWAVDEGIIEALERVQKRITKESQSNSAARQ